MSEVASCCTGLDPAAAETLASRVRAEPWLVRALAAVAASGLPGAWIGAGVIRDVVWGQLHDGFDPAGRADRFEPGRGLGVLAELGAGVGQEDAEV